MVNWFVVTFFSPLGYHFIIIIKNKGDQNLEHDEGNIFNDKSLPNHAIFYFHCL